MTTKHGGVFHLQVLEPRQLIGPMMSVVTDAGEGWIHFVFCDEPGEFELSDDGSRTTLRLSRGVALSLVALLRVAAAQFPLLGARQEGGPPLAVQAEATRHAVSVAWPSDGYGVHWKTVDDQIELRLRSNAGASVEDALATSLARLGVSRS